MPKCFAKKGSNPPVCGVHNVKLVEHQSGFESIAGGVGNFTFLVCPVSNQAVDDSSTDTGCLSYKAIIGCDIRLAR
jgi:hypothetical protein